MEFRYADEADAPFLADINRQLIQDEWDSEGMSLERLESRMRRWLSDDEYRAVLFQEGGATVAYSLVSLDEDSAYIRHFYVLKEHRSGGVGRRAVELLFREIIPPGFRVTLDVLASNHGGHRFWRSVGFRDYAIRMERLPVEGVGDAGEAAVEPEADAG
jgi:ribosomal protein S18 acetylase RimI-like enzyme